VHVISSPQAGAGVVVAIDGTSADLQAVAFDATTGKQLWSQPWSPSGMFGGMGVGAPAIVGHTVFLLQASGGQTDLVAVDASSGQPRWHVPTGSTFAPFKCGQLVCNEVQGSPTSPGGVVARDPDTGLTKWTSSGDQTFLVSKNSTLIEIHLGQPLLASLDPATGKELWVDDLTKSIGAGSDTSGGWDGRLEAGSLIGYVGKPDPQKPGAAYGADPATGTIHWLRPNLQVCPLPTTDVALLCGADSGIRRVDPATGKDVWVIDDWASPAAPGPWMGITGDGKLLVGKNHAGNPVAVDVGTGAISTPKAGQLAWVVVIAETQSRTTASATLDKYIALTDPVPWDFAATTAANTDQLRAASVPTGIGASGDGRRVFIDGNGNIVSLPA
jgi:outer membrane protein assembly factor BamB